MANMIYAIVDVYFNAYIQGVLVGIVLFLLVSAFGRSRKNYK